MSSWGRFVPWLLTGVLALLAGWMSSGPIGWALTLGLLALFALGVVDMLQREQAVRRNYPLSGRLRYLLEAVRPELRQYFLESDDDKLPFSRNQRAMVYARAKKQNDKRGMGSLRDPYVVGVEWLAHSLRPTHLSPAGFRVQVGGPACTQPYSMSVFNISGMSFGALSGAAIRALNRGAALGGFAHNTGEGGFSSHHEQGGDIVLQVASGYFGVRTPEGRFDPEAFRRLAAHAQVRMIEVKLSQGAKPGHGGVLPGAKVSQEIARTRGVQPGVDCISPARHSEFSDSDGLMDFISRLRHLSGGKPVGIKLCIGETNEWFDLVAAMLRTQQPPDFVTLDGSEGGTGAAPVEFADHVGMPMRDALHLVNQTLVGAGLRERVRIGVAGKVISAFDIARCLALGADWCNAGRGFMFAIGCIQSRSCHTDRCPTGVATQSVSRQRGLVVQDKAQRVANYHQQTLFNLAELLGAAGLTAPSELKPHHLMVRGADGQPHRLSELLDRVEPGALLDPDRARLQPIRFQSAGL